MKKNQIEVVLLLEGLVILVVFFVELVLSGGESWHHFLHAFFDLPSLLCIVLFTLPTLFATGAAKDFGRAFRIGRQAFSIGQMKKSLEAVKLVQKLVLYSCIFTMGVSFVMLMYKMEDAASIGPCVAAVILSFLYASILEMLLLPLHLHVQNWLIDAMDLINEEEE